MRRSRSAHGRDWRKLAGCVLGAAVAVGVYTVQMGSAHAAVQGKRGIEIEGARDRRGFFIGTGLGFGGTFFFVDDFIPAMRANLVLGGGVTQRFTLGANLHVTPYLASKVGVGFGGDIEATGFLWRGLFLRGGLGIGGVPRRESSREDDEGITVGLGGAASLGYEFFLNATAALGVEAIYDARFVPGTRFPRQTALIAVRFSWY